MTVEDFIWSRYFILDPKFRNSTEGERNIDPLFIIACASAVTSIPLEEGNVRNSTIIQQNARAANNTQGFLTSAIPGEDSRAPMNTLDESVWETLRRDLLAVWEKMRQVLYPKYIFGGMMTRGGVEAGEGSSGGGGMGGIDGAMGHIRGLVGRFPDADVVLQGGMSEGLSDWDLWYVGLLALARGSANRRCRGPLLFSLLLSFLLLCSSPGPYTCPGKSSPCVLSLHSSGISRSSNYSFLGHALCFHSQNTFLSSHWV